MKPISLLGAATALAMAATPAFAVNWVYVSSDSTGTIYYYDADTIQRSGNQVTAWEKGDHSRDKTVKQREKKVRYRYDCAEKTSTLLQLTKYYPDGKIEMVTWKTYEQEPQAIVPGTIGELQFEAVCTATACRTVRTRGTSFILPIGNQKDGSNDKGRPRYSAQAQGAAPC